jgi:hypothetical protein
MRGVDRIFLDAVGALYEEHYQVVTVEVDEGFGIAKSILVKREENRFIIPNSTEI